MPRANPIATAFNAGEVSPALYGRPDLEAYSRAVQLMVNMVATPQGGATRRQGTRFVAQTKVINDYLATEADDRIVAEDESPISIEDYTDKQVRPIPFVFSSTQAYMLTFGDGYIRFFMNGGQLYQESLYYDLAAENGDALTTEGGDGLISEQTNPSAQPYEIPSPYDDDDLARLQYVQTADVMLLFHPRYQPRKLSRSAHTSWSLEAWAPRNGPFLPENDTAVTLQASAASGTGVTLTASAPTFQEGHVGSLWRLADEPTAEDSYPSWEPAKSYSANDEARYGENVYQAQGAATSGAVAPVHLEGDRTDGKAAVTWRYLHSGWGVFLVTEYVSATQVRGTVLKRLPQSVVGGTTTKWREGAWSSVRGWPACANFHQQRLATAGTSRAPQTSWTSVAGDFEDFTLGPLADDALEFTINARTANPIRQISSGRCLTLHTSEREWPVEAASGAKAPLAPDDIVFRKGTSEGAAFVTPVEIDNVILFVDRSGKAIHELVFSYESEEYVTIDRTILADHIGRPVRAA